MGAGQVNEDKGILLETGTNEFEIIEFSVEATSYGINVAKVREVIHSVEVTRVAHSHPCIEGVFSLRGKIIPLVNLAKRLGVQGDSENERVIVTEINGYHFGFKVDAVTQIHRVSWTTMEPLPRFTGAELVIGIVKLGERLVVLLDFESIIAELNPEIDTKLHATISAPAALTQIRSNRTILVAEDSRMLRDILVATLTNAGYKTIVAENGLEAWNKLEQLAEEPDLLERIQLVITDIEMPQMDGHHLIKKMRENSKLQALPVMIFSSLINEEMRRKGQSLGVVAQVTKPEMAQLLDIIDHKIA